MLNVWAERPKIKTYKSFQVDTPITELTLNSNLETKKTVWFYSGLNLNKIGNAGNGCLLLDIIDNPSMTEWVLGPEFFNIIGSDWINFLIRQDD